MDLEIVNRSPLSEKLLSNATKSLEEIAELTGLTPEQAGEKLNRLLEDRGWRTERQDERLLLIGLGDMVEEAQTRLKTTDDDNFAAVAKIVLQSMHQMAARFDARRKIVDADLERITAKDARIFGETYDVAMDETLAMLMSLHPEITMEEATAAKRAGLKTAGKALSDKANL